MDVSYTFSYLVAVKFLVFKDNNVHIQVIVFSMIINLLLIVIPFPPLLQGYLMCHRNNNNNRTSGINQGFLSYYWALSLDVI